MKLNAHFFTMLLLCFAANSLLGQSEPTETTTGPSLVDRGSLLVSGLFRLESQGGALFGSDDDRSNSLSFRPSALYFVADRIAVGGQIGYDLDWADGNSTHGIGFGPRVGYYYDLGNNFIPYGTIGASYSYGWRPDFDINSNAWGLSAGVGAIYTIGNIGITAELSYNWSEQNTNIPEQFRFTDEETITADGDQVQFSVGIVGFLNSGRNTRSASTSDEESSSLIRRGNILLSGNVSFRNRGGDLYFGRDDVRSSSLIFEPNAVFFLNDHIGVGGQLGYAGTFDDEFSFHQFLIGPRVGYYRDLGNGIIPFGAVDVGYVGAWSQGNGFGSGGLGARAEVGALLTVGNLGFSGGLNYTLGTALGAGSESGNSIGLSVGIVGFIAR